MQRVRLLPLPPPAKRETFAVAVQKMTSSNSSLVLGLPQPAICQRAKFLLPRRFGSAASWLGGNERGAARQRSVEPVASPSRSPLPTSLANLGRPAPRRSRRWPGSGPCFRQSWGIAPDDLGLPLQPFGKLGICSTATWCSDRFHEPVGRTQFCTYRKPRFQLLGVMPFAFLVGEPRLRRPPSSSPPCSRRRYVACLLVSAALFVIFVSLLDADAGRCR